VGELKSCHHTAHHCPAGLFRLPSVPAKNRRARRITLEDQVIPRPLPPQHIHVVVSGFQAVDVLNRPKDIAVHSANNVGARAHVQLHAYQFFVGSQSVQAGGAKPCYATFSKS
jgi:hypothetical protein